MKKQEKQQFHISTHISFVSIFTFLFCFLFALAGSIISVLRFRQYEVFYYDFGIFDSAIWRAAHFKAPIIDHFLVGGKWIFADHFNPSIFFLSPLYWFTTNPEIILIAQATIVSISGIVLYKIGQEVLKKNFLSAGLVVSYFLFIGVQNAIITDFHEITIAVLPFMLTIYALIKNKPIFYWVFFIILLGCKESNFLIGLGIAAYILFLYKNWKLALTTSIVSLAWGLVAIHFIIPFFSGGTYLYGQAVSLNPFSYFSILDNEIKRRTIFFTYESFGFLPLFSPVFWLLQFQDFFTRMYSDGFPTRWGFGFHYSIMSGAIMAVSSVYGAWFILKRFKQSFVPIVLALLLIGNAIFLYRFLFKGPFGLSYNKVFYTHTNDFAFLNKLVSLVPPNTKVAAQNNLVSHFTHQDARILRSNHKKGYPDTFEDFKPEYIVLDTRDGQNPNDFYGMSDVPHMLESLLTDPRYQIFYHQADQYIFQRKKVY